MSTHASTSIAAALNSAARSPWFYMYSNAMDEEDTKMVLNAHAVVVCRLPASRSLAADALAFGDMDVNEASAVSYSVCLQTFIEVILRTVGIQKPQASEADEGTGERATTRASDQELNNAMVQAEQAFNNLHLFVEYLPRQVEEDDDQSLVDTVMSENINSDTEEQLVEERVDTIQTMFDRYDVGALSDAEADVDMQNQDQNVRDVLREKIRETIGKWSDRLHTAGEYRIWAIFGNSTAQLPSKPVESILCQRMCMELVNIIRENIAARKRWENRNTGKKFPVQANKMYKTLENTETWRQMASMYFGGTADVISPEHDFRFPDGRASFTSVFSPLSINNFRNREGLDPQQTNLSQYLTKRDDGRFNFVFPVKDCVFRMQPTEFRRVPSMILPNIQKQLMSDAASRNMFKQEALNTYAVMDAEDDQEEHLELVGQPPPGTSENPRFNASSLVLRVSRDKINAIRSGTPHTNMSIIRTLALDITPRAKLLYKLRELGANPKRWRSDYTKFQRRVVQHVAGQVMCGGNLLSDTENAYMEYVHTDEFRDFTSGHYPIVKAGDLSMGDQQILRHYMELEHIHLVSYTHKLAILMRKISLVTARGKSYKILIVTGPPGTGKSFAGEETIKARPLGTVKEEAYSTEKAATAQGNKRCTLKYDDESRLDKLSGKSGNQGNTELWKQMVQKPDMTSYTLVYNAETGDRIEVARFTTLTGGEIRITNITDQVVKLPDAVQDRSIIVNQPRLNRFARSGAKLSLAAKSADAQKSLAVHASAVRVEHKVMHTIMMLVYILVEVGGFMAPNMWAVEQLTERLSEYRSEKGSGPIEPRLADNIRAMAEVLLIEEAFFYATSFPSSPFFKKHFFPQRTDACETDQKLDEELLARIIKYMEPLCYARKSHFTNAIGLLVESFVDPMTKIVVRGCRNFFSSKIRDNQIDYLQSKDHRKSDPNYIWICEDAREHMISFAQATLTFSRAYRTIKPSPEQIVAQMDLMCALQIKAYKRRWVPSKNPKAKNKKMVHTNNKPSLTAAAKRVNHGFYIHFDVLRKTYSPAETDPISLLISGPQSVAEDLGKMLSSPYSKTQQVLFMHPYMDADADQVNPDPRKARRYRSTAPHLPMVVSIKKDKRRRQITTSNPFYLSELNANVFKHHHIAHDMGEQSRVKNSKLTKDIDVLAWENRMTQLMIPVSERPLYKTSTLDNKSNAAFKKKFPNEKLPTYPTDFMFGARLTADYNFDNYAPQFSKANEATEARDNLVGNMDDVDDRSPYSASPGVPATLNRAYLIAAGDSGEDEATANPRV